jgi:hypothetical protein
MQDPSALIFHHSSFAWPPASGSDIYHQPIAFHHAKPTTVQMIMFITDAISPTVHQFRCVT